MSDDTGISWTNATWNPIRGCTRVSGASVAECFAATAPTVLARDWSADRAGGGR